MLWHIYTHVLTATCVCVCVVRMKVKGVEKKSGMVMYLGVWTTTIRSSLRTLRKTRQIHQVDRFLLSFVTQVVLGDRTTQTTWQKGEQVCWK